MLSMIDSSVDIYEWLSCCHIFTILEISSLNRPTQLSIGLNDAIASILCTQRGAKMPYLTMTDQMTGGGKCNDTSIILSYFLKFFLLHCTRKTHIGVVDVNFTLMQNWMLNVSCHRTLLYHFQYGTNLFVTLQRVSKNTGPLRLIWHDFTNSQRLIIIFGRDRPYSILSWLC